MYRCHISSRLWGPVGHSQLSPPKVDEACEVDLCADSLRCFMASQGDPMDVFKAFFGGGDPFGGGGGPFGGGGGGQRRRAGGELQFRV